MSEAVPRPRAAMTDGVEGLDGFESARLEVETSDYTLKLFVTGASDLSMRAIDNVRALCDQHLPGRYQLEVVDILKDPSLMAFYQVVAAPTLIREAPLPQRMLVGDLSNTSRVLAALDILSPTAPRAVETG